MNRSSSKPILSNERVFEISEEVLEIIRNILKTRKGFNLSPYKDKCIMRRIATRIRATQSDTAEAYGNLLLTGDEELETLLKVLTIHVSEFFRNPATYSKLTDEIFPYLFDLCIKEGKKALKLWSAGCACGEEPYSLALIMKESFAAEMEQICCSIHATDVSAAVLEIAAKGIYGEDRLKAVPPQMKLRYFACCDDNFQLLPSIREMVSFEQRDICYADAFPECDLIMCRNVLIYFERKHQEKILKGFADALSSGGILVLGKSESLLGETRKPFKTICPVERIYRKI
jgi:chemotaxis protein methyltransferase CheR